MATRCNLPIHMTHPQQAAPNRPEPVVAARRILVADDSEDVAESIGMLLRIRGHDVRLAHTGRQAIEASASFQPDLILLDISLPDMSGYEVARTLRKAPGATHPTLVAVTGGGLHDDRLQAQEAGIDRHLLKPVEPKVLWKLLAELGESGRSPDAER